MALACCASLPFRLADGMSLFERQKPCNSFSELTVLLGKKGKVDTSTNDSFKSDERVSFKIFFVSSPTYGGYCGYLSIMAILQRSRIFRYRGLYRGRQNGLYVVW